MTCVAWRCIASGTCWLLGLNLRQRIAVATHREVVEYVIFDIMKPDDRAFKAFAFEHAHHIFDWVASCTPAQV